MERNVVAVHSLSCLRSSSLERLCRVRGVSTERLPGGWAVAELIDRPGKF